MIPHSSFPVAPAKAGAQGRERSAGPPRVPAFAAMTIIECGYHLLESDHYLMTVLSNDELYWSDQKESFERFQHRLPGLPGLCKRRHDAR